MDILLIKSENPKADQWKLLLQFSYLTNIQKFLKERGVATEENLMDFIAGCVQQSEEYYSASRNSSLDISPLLLYYGLTNLLAGASALLTGRIPSIKEHGLVIQGPATKLLRIGDITIKPVNSGSGALQQFANVFSGGCRLVNGDNWSLVEVLASIPDLKNDFANCYKDYPPFTIPVEIVKKPKYTLERIDPSEVRARTKLLESLKGNVLNFEQAYHEPQFTAQMNRVVLYRKMNGPDLGVYSIFGQKHLQVAHLKQNALLSPDQLILMFMGLFTLGFVSRYNPERWNTTGEKLVLEKFLEICQRYSPNLVLNSLYSRRVQFVNSLDSGIEIRGEPPPLTGEEINKIRAILDGRERS